MFKEMSQTHADMCGAHRMTTAMQPNDVQEDEAGTLRTCGACTQLQQPCSQMMFMEMMQTHADMCGVHRMAAAMQPNDVQQDEAGTCGHVLCAPNDSSHAAK